MSKSGLAYSAKSSTQQSTKRRRQKCVKTGGAQYISVIKQKLEKSCRSRIVVSILQFYRYIHILHHCLPIGLYLKSWGKPQCLHRQVGTWHHHHHAGPRSLQDLQDQSGRCRAPRIRWLLESHDGLEKKTSLKKREEVHNES